MSSILIAVFRSINSSRKHDESRVVPIVWYRDLSTTTNRLKPSTEARVRYRNVIFNPSTVHPSYVHCWLAFRRVKSCRLVVQATYGNCTRICAYSCLPTYAKYQTSEVPPHTPAFATIQCHRYMVMSKRVHTYEGLKASSRGILDSRVTIKRIPPDRDYNDWEIVREAFLCSASYAIRRLTRWEAEGMRWIYHLAALMRDARLLFVREHYFFGFDLNFSIFFFWGGFYTGCFIANDHPSIG